MRTDRLSVGLQRRLSVTLCCIYLVAVDWDCGSHGPLLPEARPHRARQVPTMTQLSSFNILIIDYPGACDLRAKLVRSGATVHVVSAAASIVLARQKRIDAAFVGFSVDADTVRLCEHLKDLGVSHIVVAPADASLSIGFQKRPTIGSRQRQTFRRYAALRASRLGAASSQPRGWSTLRRRSWSTVRSRLTRRASKSILNQGELFSASSWCSSLALSRAPGQAGGRLLRFRRMRLGHIGAISPGRELRRNRVVRVPEHAALPERAGRRRVARVRLLS